MRCSNPKAAIHYPVTDRSLLTMTKAPDTTVNRHQHPKDTNTQTVHFGRTRWRECQQTLGMKCTALAGFGPYSKSFLAAMSRPPVSRKMSRCLVEHTYTLYKRSRGCPSVAEGDAESVAGATCGNHSRDHESSSRETPPLLRQLHLPGLDFTIESRTTYWPYGDLAKSSLSVLQ
jgi:hypothetical protein